MFRASLVLREITGAFDLRRGAILNIWHFNSCRSHLDNSEAWRISHHHQGNVCTCRMLNCKGLQFPTLMGIPIPFSLGFCFLFFPPTLFLKSGLCLFYVFSSPLLSFLHSSSPPRLPYLHWFLHLEEEWTLRENRPPSKCSHTPISTASTHMQTHMNLTLTHTWRAGRDKRKASMNMFAAVHFFFNRLLPFVWVDSLRSA